MWCLQTNERSISLDREKERTSSPRSKIIMSTWTNLFWHQHSVLPFDFRLDSAFFSAFSVEHRQFLFIFIVHRFLWWRKTNFRWTEENIVKTQTNKTTIIESSRTGGRTLLSLSTIVHNKIWDNELGNRSVWIRTIVSRFDRNKNLCASIDERTNGEFIRLELTQLLLLFSNSNLWLETDRLVFK